MKETLTITIDGEKLKMAVVGVDWRIRLGNVGIEACRIERSGPPGESGLIFHYEIPKTWLVFRRPRSLSNEECAELGLKNAGSVWEYEECHEISPDK